MCLYIVHYLCHMGPHCRAYFSNCAVIGHFTCQMDKSIGLVRSGIVTRCFSSPRGWALGMRLPPRPLAQPSIACIFVCTWGELGIRLPVISSWTMYWHKNFSKETVGRTHQKFRKRDPIFPHSLCVIMVQCIVYLSIVLYSLRVCTVSVN